MIVIETFTNIVEWRWRAVLVLGSTRTELTCSHEEDWFADEEDARQAGEETVGLHLKEVWRMS